MFCVQCGKENPDSGSFCWSCGSNLFKDASRVQQNVVSPEPTTPTTDNQLPPQDKVAAESISAPNPVQYDSAPKEIGLSQPEKTGSIHLENKELKGLGGWLILVVLGLIIGMCFQFYGIYRDTTLFNDGTVQFLSDPASSVHIAGYSALLKFELICQIGIVGTTVWLLSLFFGKSRHFPPYYTAFLILIVIYVVLDYLLVASASTVGSPDFRKTLDETLSGQGSSIARSAAGALIWGFYMKKSQRVKATFVN